MQNQPQSFSIKNWSNDDKPREKLSQKGKSVLSDAELIAILIGSGSRNESAVELSKRILGSVNNNLNDLGKLSINQLMQFKGIGEAKAITITAALEIGRRRREEGEKKVEKIGSSKDVFNLLQPVLGELPHEEFWIIYLNNSNKVIHQAQLSKGGITGTLVDVRLVLKQALEIGAIGLILAHNHPSGGLKPSTADKQITEKLKNAAAALDMKVLDHIIITQREYFSFADDNLL
ncbi:RadC family protein [Cellulophaga lytica]|uniref:DNA repair protein RadC n=1 Tax=Cellulophaga lytica (strain ATCC 23178 / DSM 7489 / JCM 8516 / NBRC 14961 / NCIMB 1423 / VKM B-1433 / Cy l20) TaxID=867900 RepID=F0REX2_CELLC|nr:DNA repair protein RadC [Cellulophaga lytica]ADY29947.1 DNA repair protein RadC [Cellulophaga lytica DSM 7489]WQG75889.1 DNA repair protein RadC [Cellulophaga lytica]